MSTMMTAVEGIALARVRGTGHRLVPSQFPPIGVFESLASPDDAIAAMKLESLTNDRLQLQITRARLLQREDWLLGQPGATAVMASFLHAAPEGGRFTRGDLGAWYAARSRNTAIAETVYHQTRRIAASAGLAMRATVAMRELTHPLDARFVDLRGKREQYPEFHDANSYAQSQPFGESVRKSGAAGIIYESVRHRLGTCVVIYKPAIIPPVKQGVHLEYRWNGNASPDVLVLEQLQ
ncbi:MAG: RES family NAD+ phosphorylase [Gemmatimonadota bacterium]|nr:RES family NAD+ phosphorylase [Gemmatimonadota bacterium]